MDELRNKLHRLQLQQARGDTSAALQVERADVEGQLRVAMFHAWLEFALETLRLSAQARTQADYDAVSLRDEERNRLWRACLDAGWSQDDGMWAIHEARGDYETT